MDGYLFTCLSAVGVDAFAGFYREHQLMPNTFHRAVG